MHFLLFISSGLLERECQDHLLASTKKSASGVQGPLTRHYTYRRVLYSGAAFRLSIKKDCCKVNSSTVRELKVLWHKELTELNCNLHPIDSFSSRCKAALKAIDSGWGHPKTGRECCASNFLQGLSKLR